MLESAARAHHRVHHEAEDTLAEAHEDVADEDAEGPDKVVMADDCLRVMPVGLFNFVAWTQKGFALRDSHPQFADGSVVRLRCLCVSGSAVCAY